MRRQVMLAVLCCSLLPFEARGQASPCSAPEAGQFDFWLGTRALSWADSGRGTNTITKELGGCVVRENFRAEGANALAGMSVSTYDVRAKRWKQTWVDNQGGYLDFTGGFENGVMTLGRLTVDRDGKPLQQRMLFQNIQRDSFDWNWQRSRDAGATWETVWAICYQRRG
jgi:hypothetical protein